MIEGREATMSESKMSDEELVEKIFTPLMTFPMMGALSCDYSPLKADLLSRLKCGREAVEKLAENHDWYCGCGHWNGCNLSVCALCGRTPSESNN